jgi:hypothetical protein
VRSTASIRCRSLCRRCGATQSGPGIAVGSMTRISHSRTGSAADFSADHHCLGLFDARASRTFVARLRSIIVPRGCAGYKSTLCCNALQSRPPQPQFPFRFRTRLDTAPSHLWPVWDARFCATIFVEPPSTTRRTSPKLSGIPAAWAFWSRAARCGYRRHSGVV